MADGPAMHPIVFDFPSWTPEEREEFKAGLAESKSPIRIVTWNGLCIDGRHRVEMCRELGIAFECDEFEGTEEEAMRLAWKLNNNRRHWKSKGDQQLAAGKLAERYRLLRENSDAVSNDTAKDKNGSRSREQASADTGIPSATVSRAQSVVRDGSKKLQDAVKDGTVSVADAAAVTDQPKAAQNAAVDSVASGESKTLKAAVAPNPLCVGCERRIRKGQQVVKGCKDCKAIRGTTKKAPKKPATNTDGLPKSVAMALADTWHAECARLLSKMRVECKAAFTWSSWLDAAVLAHLKNAEECFTTSIPSKVCPDCKGQKTIDGNSCTRCRQGGYLASQV